ncbi:MAG: bifunctional 3-(3-hydroxy-phenyl)propionate/3-hydroxycinnamic acid hydroxylase [Myxococcota bacterium]
MKAACDVIVVGAGPTGLALAILLGQRGLRVSVLERHQSVYPLPRAVHLDDEVYRLLYGLGVGDAFGAITEPCLGMRLLDEEHVLLAQFDRRSLGPSGLPQANMFDQPALEELLRARLATLPTVRLEGGCLVQDIAQDADGVSAEVVDADDPSGGTPRTRRGRFLVGCDGAGSRVARHLDSSPEPLGFAQRWLVVDVRAARPCVDWKGLFQVCDPHRARTFMPVTGDRYRWEFQLRDGETPDDFAGLTRLRPLLRPWVDGLEDTDLEVLRVAGYTFRAQVARRWRDRRIFIAGDAAHLTPPFIGQGLGAGLRDAANLAWKLAEVCRERAPEALLGSYEAERRPHAREMVRRAVLVGRAMTGRGAVGLLRRVLLPLLRFVPSLSDFVLDSVTPPLTGPLVDARLPRPARGTLLPLVRVPAADGEVLVDQAIGDGFGIVARAGVVVGGLARSASVVRVRPDDSHPGLRALADWLESLAADYALIRPDRTLLALGCTRRPTGTLPALLGAPPGERLAG